MKKKPASIKTADIYIRVSTLQQQKGSGLARQEAACRAWCEKQNIVVRNVIQDVGSGMKEGGQPALHGAFDRWRKWYWEKVGEPLGEDECDAGVPPEQPPNLLVCEGADRFGRKGFNSIVLVMMLAGIKVEVILLHEMETKFQIPIDFSKPMVISGKTVQFHKDGSVEFGKAT